MELRCKNDETHNRFGGTALVIQEWEVDVSGNFENVLDPCSDVLRRPNEGDDFECLICYGEVEVK